MIVKAIDPSFWTLDLPIHGSAGYLNARQTRYIYFGCFDQEGLCFALPFWLFRKGPFRWAMPTGETLVIRDSGAEAEKAFLDVVVERLRQLGMHWIAHSPTNGVFRTFPTGATAVPFGSYRIALQQDETVLWSAVHSKHRNVIRNAQKLGLKISRESRPTDAMYAVFSQTMARSGKKFETRQSFDRLIESLGTNVEIFSVLQDQRLCGCAVFPWSRHSAYYLWGGSPDSPPLGAMNLLHWEAMLHFRRLGVQLYDFVGARLSPEPGSKLEGIQRFKARFGPELATGYLWKHVLNTHSYSFYKTARSVLAGLRRQRWPGDVVDQELRKAACA